MNHYLEEFCRTTEELLGSDAVRMMGRWKHHGHISTLDHSLFVAYCSYRAARALRLDETAAARAGLLHDLYLYDSRDTSAHPGWQCFDHPRAAARNAAELTALSEKERNIILSHMWPLGGQLPRSWEAWLVDLVDTCAPAWSWPTSITPDACGSGWGSSPSWRRSWLLPPADSWTAAVPVIPGAAAALRFEVSCPKTRES